MPREAHDEAVNKGYRWFGSAFWLASILAGVLVLATPAATLETTTQAELDVIARDLLKALGVLSRHEAPKIPPPIVQIPQDEVSALICGKPCGVQAAYLPERGIVMSDSLDPAHKSLDRSILLHELVHYVQELEHHYASETQCRRWFLREKVAYALQNAYLMSIQSLSHVGGIVEPSRCNDSEKEPAAFER